MSEIEKIKKLRKSTGAGFKDCSSAISESNGDLEKAAEILRVKGISKASKKMSRVANEGVVALSENENSTSIIEVNCETDFVAKNEDFIDFVKELNVINNACSSDMDKIRNSKMKNSQTVDENLIAIISKIGEKITLGRSKTLDSKDCHIFKYLHTIVKDNISKLAVMVSLETSNNSESLKNFGKHLAMHIAASNPLALDIEGIEKSLIEKEEELIKQELSSSGKPSDIVNKISVGKINKFKEDNTLLNQPWVIEPKKKVKEVIKELNIKDLKIKNFFRLKIGE